MLIAAVGVLIFVMLGDDDVAPAPAPPPMPEVERGARGTVVTPENLDEILELLQQPIPDAQFHTHMTIDWVFPTTNSPALNALVANSTSNTRTIFFEVNLTDTGELVYSSPFIPVGQRHTNFALDANLPVGTHNAVVTYVLVDDDYQPITTVAVGVALTILE